jgi:WD40 repeat protein
MYARLRQRLGPTTRFLLGQAGILALLLAVGGAWWGFPARPRAILPATRTPCREIIISANGNTLVAIHEDCLAAWDVARQQEQGFIPYDTDLPDQKILVAPDGQKLALAYGKTSWGPVKLWQPATQSRPVSIPLPDSFTFIDFTADSRFLIIWCKSTNQNTYKLWDTATARERALPMKLEGRLEAIQPLRDGNIVVSEYDYEPGWLADEVCTKVWTLTSDLRVASAPIVLRGISGSVTVSRDGRLLTALRLDGGQHITVLFDARTGRALNSSAGSFTRAQFNSDASELLLGDTIWDITTMPPRQLGTVKGQPMRLKLSPDGNWVADGTCVAVAMDWNILDVTNLDKPSLWHNEGSEPIFSPDSQTLAATILDPPPSSFTLLVEKWSRIKPTKPTVAVKVWQLPSFQEIASFDQSDLFAYFPDRRGLAVARPDGTIDIWDIPPRRPWYIEYALPVLFVLLLLLAFWHCLQFRRKLALTANAVTSSTIEAAVAPE